MPVQALRRDEEPILSAGSGVARPAIVRAPAVRTGVYGARRLNLPMLAGAALLHALLLLALLRLDVVVVPALKREPVVATLISLPPEPPPVPPPPPDTKVEPVDIVRPAVVAPPPIVAPPVPPPALIQTAPEPPPVQATVVAPPQPAAPAPAGPVRVTDLAATVLSADPPRYPVESRRRREEGTVVLSVLLSTAGTVSEIAIARSSGHDRLDKAARDAVRRWRWKPMIRDGGAVMVRGIVEIPFVLTR